MLCLCGFLYWLQGALGPVIGKMQSEQVITAYLTPEVEERDQSRILDTIRVSLGAAPIDAARAEVKLVDPTQFMKSIRAPFPELARELEGLGGDAAAVVPRFVTVSGILPAGALERVRDVHGVESAESSHDRNKQVVGAFQALRWVLRLLAAGLLVALLMGLIQLSRANAQSHADAVSLLRLWGARESTLRLPSVLSGASVGLAGAGAAALGWLAWGSWLVRHVRATSPFLQDLAPAGGTILVALVVGGVVLGTLSGLLGAAID
jgi:cell division protein FtsX